MILRISLLLLVAGCSSVPITTVEIQKITIPSELLDIPEYSALTGTSNIDVSNWIIQQEKRCRYMENNLKSIEALNK